MKITSGIFYAKFQINQLYLLKIYGNCFAYNLHIIYEKLLFTNSCLNLLLQKDIALVNDIHHKTFRIEQAFAQTQSYSVQRSRP